MKKTTRPSSRRTRQQALKAESTSAQRLSPAMKPIGLLGGGQLARLLALEAHTLGLPVTVFSASADDPAAQVVSRHVQGRLDDHEAIKNFLSTCSLVTFESEFMNAEMLGSMAKRSGVTVFPAPAHMALIQDRLPQKKLLAEHAIPTAPFREVHDQKTARDAYREFDGKVVFKKRRFGYDGYGTFVVRGDQELQAFLARLHLNDSHGLIAEPFVRFRRELAVMVVRSRTGETRRLPFVESHQENSRCLWVKGPLRPSRELEKLGRRLEKMLTDIGYVGIMGVELFETARGLLVNELAPRVHNSGHYSLDAMSENQFGLHLKAILGLELGQPVSLAKGFAMWNLLGSHEHTPSWRLPPDVTLHWYGKSENRAGRKLGHLNATGTTPAKALERLRKARPHFDL